MPGLMFVLVDLLFLLPMLLLQNFAFCKLLCHELLFVEAVFSPQFLAQMPRVCHFLPLPLTDISPNNCTRRWRMNKLIL